VGLLNPAGNGATKLLWKPLLSCGCPRFDEKPVSLELAISMLGIPRLERNVFAASRIDGCPRLASH
jgi:hypothetical protein